MSRPSDPSGVAQRAAFGFTRFRNYRIRSLLCAGNPNWDLLAAFITRRDPKPI